jgi:hypothetical protein
MDRSELSSQTPPQRAESAEEITRRLPASSEGQLQRESDLEDSLAPFHVSSGKYLNAVPLTRGLEEQVAIRHAVAACGSAQGRAGCGW